jgi:predicted DNA-binding transcriptional regulator YafY
MAEGVDPPLPAPPGLAARLRAGLDPALRESAARRAARALERIYPRPAWEREEEPPPAPPRALRRALQESIEREADILVRYQAAGRPAPEVRRLSPLLLEERGSRWYLLAYCHLRRANRLFRVDRLELLEADSGQAWYE